MKMKILISLIPLCFVKGSLLFAQIIGQQNNSFEMKGTSYVLDQCTIANESYSNTSKFEIDLSCCNLKDRYNKPDSINYTNFIWLSIFSKSITDLAEGEYRYSSTAFHLRDPMTFYGTILSDNKTENITDGKITIARINDKIKVQFNLIADYGVPVKGEYSGFFSFHDRISLK